MFTLHPQYVIDENQRKSAVILPLAEWEQIVEEMEELEDIRAYDAAKSDNQESIPFEQAVREIQQECKD
jgi:PHD/YefM family antitoxin component YafN of YafNO toxin-antitoxin module